MLLVVRYEPLADEAYFTLLHRVAALDPKAPFVYGWRLPVIGYA